MRALEIVFLLMLLALVIVYCSGCATVVCGTVGLAKGAAVGAGCDMAAVGIAMAAMNNNGQQAEDARDGTGDYEGLGSLIERFQGGY